MFLTANNENLARIYIDIVTVIYLIHKYYHSISLLFQVDSPQESY